MEVMDEAAVVARAEGVGERLYGSTGKAESEQEREGGWKAGTGVDTPSAFASLARRWGESGARGGCQLGDKASTDELGD